MIRYHKQNMVWNGLDPNNNSGVQKCSHLEVPTKYQCWIGITISMPTGRSFDTIVDVDAHEFAYIPGQRWVISNGKCPLGPVYTTVRKSTGHEKKGVSQLWLVENATLDRWVFTLGEENNAGELFSWMIKWHGRLRGGTFWSWSPTDQ